MWTQPGSLAAINVFFSFQRTKVARQVANAAMACNVKVNYVSIQVLFELIKQFSHLNDFLYN